MITRIVSLEKDRSKKPEWKIILDFLIQQDTPILYKICRKMIINLERLKAPEIYLLLEQLNPSLEIEQNIQHYGANWPKPKGSPFIPNEIISKVFEIADKYIPDDEIFFLLNQWINKEKLSDLARVLEKRYAPLSEVVEAVKKYFRQGGSKDFTTIEERIGVRVSLIYRFLSENLTYINIAKHFITLISIAKILDRIVGPSYGSGKVGGKSAGLVLAEQILLERKKTNPLLENVSTPKSWYLSSDGILEFINYNAIDEFTFTKYQSLENIRVEYQFLEYIFKNSRFTPEALSSFNLILDDLEGKPIVVRSSSLLEDSFEASFTGKYKSLFVANTGTKEERLNALTNAITEVYASTFGPDPIEYRKVKGLLDFREEMGILIQEVVGHKIGKYFMPSYAGVAMSHNEFRWSNRIKREDGVVRIVAGLGTRAVDRTMNDYPTLISPGAPGLKVNLTLKDTIKYSQNYVDLINLETNKFETISFKQLIRDTKGDIPAIEHIVSYINNNTLMKPVGNLHDFTNEELVITFANLMENTKFIEQMKAMLDELSKAYKGPVDIEFASDGKKLYLLQCRPQSQFNKESIISIPANVSDHDKIFTAEEYVNNGKFQNIEYVVYVDSKGYSELKSEEEMQEVGRIVSKLNKSLPKRKFILIGPGRWGSKGDIKLGVPIQYSDINNTAMLIEYARKKAGYLPELSFGTHFFQDLVEANIKYLPLYPDKEGNIFNTDFFNETKNSLNDFLNGYEQYNNVVKVLNVNHYVDNSVLNIFMDGNNGKALAFIKKIERF